MVYYDNDWGLLGCI